jgi:long-chain acyl-CoA synthetase
MGSGTTGRPEGAELMHRNILANVLVGEKLFEPDRDNPDIYLCVLPLFDAFGQATTQNSALAFGGTMVLMPRFDPLGVVALMVQEEVTIFAGFRPGSTVRFEVVPGVGHDGAGLVHKVTEFVRNLPQR